MASKKVTEFVILCAPLTLICIHRDNVLLFPFIAQMIGPIISAVGNLIPCFYFLVLCFVLFQKPVQWSVSEASAAFQADAAAHPGQQFLPG